MVSGLGAIAIVKIAISTLTGGLFFAHRFLAVFLDSLNALAVGAPLEPGFLIFSPEPAAIRFLLAWMLSYSPFFFTILLPIS